MCVSLLCQQGGSNSKWSVTHRAKLLISQSLWRGTSMCFCMCHTSTAVTSCKYTEHSRACDQMHDRLSYSDVQSAHKVKSRYSLQLI